MPKSIERNKGESAYDFLKRVAVLVGEDPNNNVKLTVRKKGDIYSIKYMMGKTIFMIDEKSILSSQMVEEGQMLVHLNNQCSLSFLITPYG